MEGSPGVVKKEKNYHISKWGVIYWIFIPFFLSSFPFKPTFRRILPSFFRVSKGQSRKQTRCASFLSPQQCLKFLSSLAVALKKTNFFFILFISFIDPLKPWRRREESSEMSVWKERRKERREWKSNKLHLIWIGDNFFILHYPWAVFHYFQYELLII